MKNCPFCGSDDIRVIQELNYENYPIYLDITTATLVQVLRTGEVRHVYPNVNIFRATDRKAVRCYECGAQGPTNTEKPVEAWDERKEEQEKRNMRQLQTLEQFADYINIVFGERPNSQRLGQYAFNVLESSYPDTANKIRRTECDPYYYSSHMKIFLIRLLTEIEASQ